MSEARIIAALKAAGLDKAAELAEAVRDPVPPAKPNDESATPEAPAATPGALTLDDVKQMTPQEIADMNREQFAEVRKVLQAGGA